MEFFNPLCLAMPVDIWDTGESVANAACWIKKDGSQSLPPGLSKCYRKQTQFPTLWGANCQTNKQTQMSRGGGTVCCNGFDADNEPQNFWGIWGFYRSEGFLWRQESRPSYREYAHGQAVVMPNQTFACFDFFANIAEYQLKMWRQNPTQYSNIICSKYLCFYISIGPCGTYWCTTGCFERHFSLSKMDGNHYVQWHIWVSKNDKLKPWIFSSITH